MITRIGGPTYCEPPITHTKGKSPSCVRIPMNAKTVCHGAGIIVNTIPGSVVPACAVNNAASIDVGTIIAWRVSDIDDIRC
jgi:hypothetical protein